jgi:hypothetical protein
VDGGGTLQIDFNLVDAFKVMAIKEGHITASAMLSPGILLDADDDELVLPQEFSLRQNFPNPFNPITTISFSASSSGLLILTVYNILGQEVTTLASEWFSPGRYDVVWNGRDRYDREVASGVYFARLRQGDDFAVIKMTLLK